MKLDSQILVAGANGMVGSAIVRNLKSKGYTNIIEATRLMVDFTCLDRDWETSICESSFIFTHVLH